MEKIGIGLLGYGAIGKIHTLCYKDIEMYYPGQLPAIDLAAVCTSKPETARRAAQEGGYRTWCADASALIHQDDVTVVDCSLPNFAHKSVLLEAIAAGKHVYCEKPLAMNGTEAREIAKAAAAAQVQVGMTFNYRFVPALLRAHELVQEGALGEIYRFQAEYLHTGYESPERPLSWRLNNDKSGGGALADLGAHAIDLMRLLLGEFQAVQAITHTYIKERPIARGVREKGAVTVDDAAWLQVKLENGAIGTIEASRFSTGVLDELRFEICGEKGALRFNLMDANYLYWFDASRKGGNFGGEQGWMRLDTIQQYPGASIPSPRAVLGWTRTHAENQYTFLKAIVEGHTAQPNIVDGLRTQLILDAAYASAEHGGWVDVEKE
ncbi:MAG: Gfo/Idh/MocA family oxidoreductase [bacterium]|nr:Gfo/Idh/MocA family oxidoreductase [bacterium]